MEQLKQQVSTLTAKVDVMSEEFKQLNHKISDFLSEIGLNTAQSMNPSTRSESIGRYQSRDKKLSAAMQHKDVLADDNYPDRDSRNPNKQLSPELQIQRLTAQLTAAYNRIAALEEQLLSQRIH